MFRFILLFPLALLCNVSAGEYLAVVDDLVETRVFHVIEQIRNRSLVIVNDEEIDRLQTRKYGCSVLDENPKEKIYYLVFPIREDRKSIERVATILVDFQDHYLVRVAQTNEQHLLDLRAEFNYVELDRMLFPTRIPPEILNARITGDPIIQEIVNSVSTDTLESFVRHLQEIPSRHVNYPFLADQAVPWIVEKLEAYGCDSVYIQEVPNYNAPNAIGIKLGAKFPSYTKYYMIGGHPDCQPNRNPNYGADDNGSGTAAFLEAARVLKDYEFDYTIVYMAFNAEEVGMHGSAHYAKTASDRGDSILSVLNMERCGHVYPNQDRIFLTYKKTMPGTKILADLFMQAAETYNTNLTCAYNPVELTNSDHASFWKRGYLAIMSKEEHEPSVYHTVNDTLNHPDGFNSLEFFTSVVQTGVATLAELATLTPTPIKAAGLKNEKAAVSIQRVSCRQVIIRSSLRPADIKTVALYNARGRRVRTLKPAQNSDRFGVYHWNGTNNSGEQVSAGVYFIVVQSTLGNYCTSLCW